MKKTILIDAEHSEEVRLVLTEDAVIKSFYHHNKDKASVKGNVYLAKVTRVEPSLQAAFVDYGGYKQGFLPFAEIHPDYYHLPKDDKEQLLKMLSQTEKEEVDVPDIEMDSDDEKSASPSRPVFYKKYRIQDVIKKEQVFLVQIAKEERGNKGVSLTTYISLAGRYCVFLPNSTRAGGVSRKIEDQEERKRLKDLIEEFEEQLGGASSIIVRTAGAYKTKVELKRDFSYLSRLWGNIRQHTMSSVAPTFIHEEGDIIKKAIRDLYESDVEEIVVSGDEAYENAKNFTKLLLPRHVDKVKRYSGHVPLFSKFAIEEQLAHLYDSTVQLSSGGCIVINQTEALVAIDVNSGRSTSERTVESTALKNNLEAVQEIFRQVGLRDLSGLIVIDFIDMEEAQNRRVVEKALREAFSKDKAKTQMGRISEFGLLEMSRQRLRQSLAETYTVPCEYCVGRGKVRPQNVTAIAIIRAIENESANGAFNVINISACKNLTLFLLNNKCAEIAQMEMEHGIKVNFGIDEEAGADGFFLEGVKLDIPLERIALSKIDHEPYRLDHQDVSSFEDEKGRTQPLTRGAEKKPQSEPHENEARISAKPKRTRYRKRFRKSNRDADGDVNSFEARGAEGSTGRSEGISVVQSDAPVAQSKNNSLLLDIWKKIMD